MVSTARARSYRRFLMVAKSMNACVWAGGPRSRPPDGRPRPFNRQWSIVPLPSLLALAVLCLVAAPLEAAPLNEDGRWVFENDTLRVSVDEKTARWDVFDKRCDRLWRQAGSAADEKRAVVVNRVTPLPAPAVGVEVEMDYPAPGGAVSLTVCVRLLPGKGDVSFEVSGNPAAEIRDLALPAPFVLQTPEGVLVIPQASGLLFGVDELEWDGRTLGGKYSMPWFGATDLATGQGYLTVLGTLDDATFRGVKLKGPQGDVLSARAVLRPQKGKLGYARKLLVHFVDQGGYVALAKRYRAYAKQAGLLKTLAEKRKERPLIDRLVGAVNIYCSNFQNIRELRRVGIERAMVSGFSSDYVRQMNDWGYLTSHYDIYTDLYEPGTPPSNWERCQGFTFPDDVIKKQDGSNQIGWCPVLNPKTGKKDPSYVICSVCGLRGLKEKMPPRLEKSPYTAYFLDCVTSARLYECFDPKHPMTRTTDREARMQQFAYLSEELGLVVGSETGRDWGVPVADYFEGIMSTAAFFATPKAIHELPFVSIESTPRYEEYGTNPARRVPLFQLVYGDCVETTWRWGDNTHRMPKLWAQKDLLHMVHASMPTWVLWNAQQGLFWGNTERFRECYDNVCRWRRAVGYAEMTTHERLHKDGLLQRSCFANGASVTVNFATENRALEDGRVLPARSFLIEGDAESLQGLPVGKPVRLNDDWSPREYTVTGNTGFERGPCLWHAARGMQLDVQEAVAHGGRRAARLEGTQPDGFSFASAVKVPIEAGKKYTLRGWLRVDAAKPQDTRPGLKCAIYKNGKFATNIYTNQYDSEKLGTWQKLERTFTAPEGATEGLLALEKRARQTVEATLYLDDVELVPFEPEPQDIAGPPGSGWKLVFDESFNGNEADLDARWTFQNGPSGHILSSRWRENARLEDGLLKMIARKERRAEQEWTAANLWSKQQFTYGYFECRYRYAAATGTNNSFWLMTEGPGKESGRFEIDINEGHYPYEVNMNLHQHSGKHWIMPAQWHLHGGVVEATRDDAGFQFVLDKPLVTSKLRLVSSDADIVRVMELRAFAPSAEGYPKIFPGSQETRPAAVNLAAEATAEANSVLQPQYGPEKAIDGELSTVSRWVSGKQRMPRILTLSFAEPRKIGCIHLISGWEDGRKWQGIVQDFHFEYWDGNAWQPVPGAKSVPPVEPPRDPNAPPDLGHSFHVYGLLWNEKELVFYFDGREIRRMENTICHGPSPIRLSLAIIRWAGPVTDAIDGKSMDVDWVRVWQRPSATQQADADGEAAAKPDSQ